MIANAPNAAPVSFRPTVVVGLGGMGTFVAYRVLELVKRQLDRQVRAGLITADLAAQAMAERFKFVGIDSDKPWYKEAFGPGFMRIGTSSGVDATLDRRYLREPEFQRWWHRNSNGKWMLPGEYVNGCGHVRLKGRLAYFLEREQGSLDAGEAIRAAVQESTTLAKRLPSDANPVVTVFVCTSLSGGTGGGLFLTVLNSIKAIESTRTYGVVIDTSIADMQTVGFRRDQERANFRAGLMELDAWLSGDSPLLDALGWDTYWPDARHPLPGARPCADVVWLFDRRNKDRAQAGTQLQAINASAEAIATWIHSSATDRIDAIDSDVMAAVANLDQHVPTVSRAIRYGAMGVSHLEFAADRAAEYLATTLAVDVVRDHVTARQPGTQEIVNRLVDDACREWALVEKGQDQILSVLRSLRQSAPAAPALGPSLNGAANGKAYPAIVKAAVERLDGPDGRHAGYSALCGKWVAVRLAGDLEAVGLRERLRSEVSRIIASSPGGFAVAVEFLTALEARITSTEAADIRRELDDPREGKRAERDRLAAGRVREVEHLPGRFGREGRIAEFAGGWWRSWQDVNLEIVARESALDLYDGVVEEIHTAQKALASARASLDDATAQFRARGENALKELPEAERGAITVSLLTGDPALLRMTFPPVAGPAKVAALFASEPGDGLVPLFEACLDQQRVLDAPADQRADGRKAQTQEKQAASQRLKAVLGDRRFARRLEEVCQAQFSAAVRGFSVWDALEAQVRHSAPAADWAVLDREAGRLLRELAGFSSPMFPFAAIGSTSVGLSEPSESAILVTNVDAAVHFAERNGAGGAETWLSDWVRGPLQMPPSIVDTLDRQTVSIVRRAIGFPLLAAAPGWGSEDAAALADVERLQFVWADERAARMPRDFDPLDTVEVAWIAALAAREGVLAEAPDGAWSWKGRQIASGLADLRRHLLLLDRTAFRRLSEEVFRKVRTRTVEEWEDVLRQMEAELKADAPARPEGSRAAADREARNQIRKVVTAKLDALQGADEPAASTLWPHAFQTQAGAETSG